MRRLDDELTATLAELRDLFGAGETEIGRRGRDVGEAAAAIAQAAERVDDLARNLNGVVGPETGGRRDFEAALRDLAATASSLKSFARQIDRNPNALLLGTKR